tara:strand:- start:1 stop:1695 length:1695 start_codon:yes stop_codon:yes gene_type:complete
MSGGGVQTDFLKKLFPNPSANIKESPYKKDTYNINMIIEYIEGFKKLASKFQWMDAFGWEGEWAGRSLDTTEVIDSKWVYSERMAIWGNQRSAETIFEPVTKGHVYRGVLLREEDIEQMKSQKSSKFPNGAMMSAMLHHCCIRAGTVKEKNNCIITLKKRIQTSNKYLNVLNKTSSQLFDRTTLEGHIYTGGSDTPHLFQSSVSEDNKSYTFEYSNKVGNAGGDYIPYILKITLDSTRNVAYKTSYEDDNRTGYEGDHILKPIIPLDLIEFIKREDNNTFKACQEARQEAREKTLNIFTEFQQKISKFNVKGTEIDTHGKPGDIYNINQVKNDSFYKSSGSFYIKDQKKYAEIGGQVTNQVFTFNTFNFNDILLKHDLPYKISPNGNYIEWVVANAMITFHQLYQIKLNHHNSLFDIRRISSMVFNNITDILILFRCIRSLSNIERATQYRNRLKCSLYKIKITGKLKVSERFLYDDTLNIFANGNTEIELHQLRLHHRVQRNTVPHNFLNNLANKTSENDLEIGVISIYSRRIKWFKLQCDEFNPVNITILPPEVKVNSLEFR